MSTTTPFKTTLIGLSTICLLGACGLRGPLKTPPPMWEDKPQAEDRQPDESAPEAPAMLAGR